MNPRVARECSKTACDQPAVATLAYAYAEATAILGPLTRDVEPHAYDLCAQHSERLTVPRGWTIIRVPSSPVVAVDSTADLDLFVPDQQDAPVVSGDHPSAQAHVRRPRAPRRTGATRTGERHLRLVPNSNPEGDPS